MSFDQTMESGDEKPGSMGWRCVFGAAAAMIGLIAVLAASGVELLYPEALAGSARRLAVSGVVLFEGKRLEAGTIDLVPQIISSDEPCFLSRKTELRDGEFQLPEHDGLCPGIYLVRIRSELVETSGLEVCEEELGQRPCGPCERRAPLIRVKRDGPNHFEIDVK